MTLRFAMTLRVVDSGGGLQFNIAMAEYLPEAVVAQTVFWMAGTLAFIMATLGAVFAWPKYWRELKAREWDRAHQAYEKFLDVAVTNPEFVPGYWSDPVRTPGERNKYRWFLARFLWAAEQALLRVGGWRRNQWKQAVRVMLREHADFLSSPEAREEVTCYYGPLKHLIPETIDHAAVPTPMRTDSMRKQ